MRKNNLFLNLSILFFIVICCSGFSFLQPFRIYLIGLFSILLIFYHIKGHNLYVLFRQDSKLMIIFIVLMFLGLRTTYNRIETLKYIYVFITGLIMLIMPLGDKFNYKVIKGIDICIKVIAISIIINAIIPRLFVDNLSFLIAGGSSRIATEIKNHVYSGLMGEKAEAAYIIIIGIIILLSNCVKEKGINNKNKVWLFIYLTALLLPAKRMLFAIGVLICLEYVLLWNGGKRKIGVIIGFLVLGMTILLLATKIPTLNTLINRFVAFSSDSTNNGRTYLWEYATDMFNSNKIFGMGYGSFNTYASMRGIILTASGDWNAHAHNIYYQLLGEMGITGLLVFVLLLINNFITYVKLYIKRKKIEKNDTGLLFIGINILILTIIYGYSGNCIYNTNQMMILFFSMTLCSLLKGKYILKSGEEHEK